MKANARKWFSFQNAADDPATVEIHIIDVIGSWDDDFWNRLFGEPLFGVTARAFIEELAALPDAIKNIHLHINSPGGDVQGAVNIANALRDQQLTKGRTVVTSVDGMAASAASIIAMAGSTVRIADNGLMMIHKPIAGVMGTAKDLRSLADVLDTVTLNQIISTYQWHSPLTAEAIDALLDAETWMDADQAIANGFCTEKVSGLKAAASISPRGVSALNVPDRFKTRVAALLEPAQPTPTPPVSASAAEILAAVETAGLSVSFARELMAAAPPMADVTARIASVKAERSASDDRAASIRSLCATAKLPTVSDRLINLINGTGQMQDVHALLTDITAAMNQAQIDTGLQPEGDGRTQKSIDMSAIYAGMNTPKAK